MKVCGAPGCPELATTGWCPQHTPKPWSTSTRNQRRQGSGWAEQARHQRILRRSTICHICGQPGADKVDHIVALSQGGTNDPTNLAPIHQSPCHQAKTANESRAARRQRTR